MIALLTSRLSRYFTNISADEIARQYQTTSDAEDRLTVAIFIVYGMAAVFIPLEIALACMLVDMGGEKLHVRLIKGLVPAQMRWRYIGSVLAALVAQLAYMDMLHHCYHSDGLLAKPFVTVLLITTTLRIATVRSIHLPYAMAELALTAAVTLFEIAHHWPNEAGPMGTGLTVFFLIASLNFIAREVVANHALHAELARETAAAKAADQAKSRFLAQMSHELRTPLNAILGLGHVELKQASDAGSIDRLRLITDAAAGLSVILDDILDMSAIDAGRLAIRPALCSPGVEIASITALYQPLYSAQGLSLKLHLATNLPPRAVIDAQRLRQFLLNLLSNALKYTAEGGVSVFVKRTADGKLAITFTDTGPGICPKDAENLFQPFHRGTSDMPSRGLGLAISRSLAQSMGGGICSFCPQPKARSSCSALICTSPRTCPHSTRPHPPPTTANWRACAFWWWMTSAPTGWSPRRICSFWGSPPKRRHRVKMRWKKSRKTRRILCFWT
jgi:signal transduction histidine kinase